MHTSRAPLQSLLCAGQYFVCFPRPVDTWAQTRYALPILAFSASPQGSVELNICVRDRHLGRDIIPTPLLFPSSPFLCYFRAARTPQPVQRMIEVVRWYLSGFYKKPKGVKKPYNPILGEYYRCYWKHKDGAKTIYVAEQVWLHTHTWVFCRLALLDVFVISSYVGWTRSLIGLSCACV